MLVCKFRMVGESTLAWGRPVFSEQKSNETIEQRERRVWREKFHTGKNGNLVIPAQALKLAIVDYAAYKGEKIPGKGQTRYLKFFEAGTMVLEDIDLGVKPSKLKELPLYVPSDGKKGGGRRVWRWFPLLEDWAGEARVYVVDREVLTPEKVHEYVAGAGVFIGVGFWRVRRGGTRGRWRIENFETEEI